ncbi:hypothetical protein B0J14DRAFT_63560 [Halenospora varia]|nr:hypothetical protein B0J14DRAFT_63560 [Halenospora varia]
MHDPLSSSPRPNNPEFHFFKFLNKLLIAFHDSPISKSRLSKPQLLLEMPESKSRGMSKSDSQRIQSSQARGGGDMSSSGFAARAQGAADRAVNAANAGNNAGGNTGGGYGKGGAGGFGGRGGAKK